MYLNTKHNAIYIDILPKELRDELQYFINYPYWKCLNELLWYMYIQTTNVTEGSTILGQRYSYFLTKSDVKHITVIKGQGLTYDIHYQIPNTELVTVYTLAKCITLLYQHRFDELSHILQIGTLNETLTNFGCKEQIVYYVRKFKGGHKSDFIAIKL